EHHHPVVPSSQLPTDRCARVLTQVTEQKRRHTLEQQLRFIFDSVDMQITTEESSESNKNILLAGAPKYRSFSEQLEILEREIREQSQPLSETFKIEMRMDLHSFVKLMLGTFPVERLQLTSDSSRQHHLEQLISFIFSSIEKKSEPYLDSEKLNKDLLLEGA